MTKAELKCEIARNLKITLKEARVLLDVILGGMARALRDGDRIEIRRFGTFHTQIRPARQVRNPLGGAPLGVEARRVAAFRASDILLQMLNRRGRITD